MQFDPKEYIWCYPQDDGRYKPGVWDNTATPQEIEEYPDRRWAVACGSKTGILVIDLDEITDEGSAWIEATGITRVDTMKVRTPSGGYHWYFQYPDKGKFPRMIRPVPGIDLLGDNGLVYCIPSPDYELRTEPWIAPLPEGAATSWLALANSQPRQKEPDTDDIFIEEGQRNDRLFKVGVALRKKDYSERDIRHILRGENADRFRPPLGDGEVEIIVGSVWAHVETPEPIPQGSYGLGVTEIMAMEIDPLGSLCGPLPTGCTIHIAGPAGVGKSFWILHMMAAVASHSVFGNNLAALGWRGDKALKVLYIDGEMPWRFIQPRLAQVSHLGGVLNIVTEEYLTAIGLGSINLGNEQWQEYFLNAPFDVIVFDTASSLLDTISGGASKDAEHWNQVVKFNTSLRSQGKSVIYIDHTSDYNKTRIEGSIGKVNKTDLALVILDEREEIEKGLVDHNSPPLFRVVTRKNRVGALSAASRWVYTNQRFMKM